MADRSFAILQDKVVDLMRGDLIAAGDPVAVAEAIWATLHGVTAMLLDQADKLCTPGEVLVETALDLLEAGLIGTRPKISPVDEDKPC